MQQYQDTTLAEQTVFIYGLLDPRDALTIYYVGRTTDLKVRLTGHIYNLQSQTPHELPKVEWVQSLRKAGLKPQLRVLDETTSERAVDVERQWIAKCSAAGMPLTNCHHNPPTPSKANDKTIRTSRVPKYTERVVTRLTVEDNTLFEQIAKDRGLPPAILARDWLTDHLASYRSERIGTDA